MSQASNGGQTLLIEAIESRLKKVQTQSLDLSFNELLDMHQSGELNISPEYQRLFQWSEGARSRFIESLLLEMPVPPIYVIEEQDGCYSLIDGLQRISSYLHLRGRLVLPNWDPPVKEGDFLELSECDIVEELNGLTYNDLPTNMQIRLKRAFVRVEVVRKGSDSRFKYHMFKRLNQGGQRLTEQQLRNCTVRLLGSRFIDFIEELTKLPDFQLCTANLTQEKVLGRLDQELILRFFALRNYRDKFRHDVSDFLTEYMERVSDPDTQKALPFDFDSERVIFERTFGALAATLGDKAFAYANKERTSLVTGFSIYHFESLTIGLQSFLVKISSGGQTALDALSTALSNIKMDEAFCAMTTGGGKNSAGRLRERIQFVDDRLREVYGP